MNLAMSSAQNTYSLLDLLAGMANVDAAKNLRLSGIEIDSRKVSAGDLFIALPGTRQHGNTYIDAAIRQGAIAVVYDASTELPADLDSEIPLIKITDISQQAGFIASRFYNEPSKSMRVTGITGTNGKTTCCVLLAQAYKYLGARPGLIGTLGMGLWGEMVASTHTTPDVVTLQSEMSQLRDQGSDERHHIEGFEHMVAYERSQIAHGLHGHRLVKQLQRLVVVDSETPPEPGPVGWKAVEHFDAATT